MIYTITVIDINDRKNILGTRRTPVIFTRLESAIFAVQNNSEDLCDGGTYLYAVIEETQLDTIRPHILYETKQFWFRYNSAFNEYEPILKPEQFQHQSGFGIG
jgi:hypothetical protein